MSHSEERGSTLRSQWFSFDSSAFAWVVPHGGAKEIATARVLSGPQDAACDFLDLSIIPPGADIGIHTHGTQEEEYYIIVSGLGEMHVDGQTFSVRSGDVIRNRPGGTHGLRNTGEHEILLVVIQVPTQHPSLPDPEA